MFLSDCNKARVAAASPGALDWRAGALFLPVISARVDRFCTMTLRNVTTSCAMKAAQATSSVTVLVSIMIPICLRLMEAFLMRIMTMAAVVVTALGSGGYLPGLARFATLPTARLPVLYRSAGGFPSRILLAPGPGRPDLEKGRPGRLPRVGAEP